MANFFQTLGADVKKVFSWLGSPAGQATIQAGEAVVESVYPPATALINIANNWLTEAIKTEALGAAAAVGSGSGAQKAAATIAAVTPEVLSFAQQNGLPAPTAAKLQEANTALVAFINALTGKTAS